MDWTNKSILMFLRLYRLHPCIWNPKHKLNKSRKYVNDAWAKIQNHMPIPCTIPQLKKKKESLMSAYRSYKTKIKSSMTETGGYKYQPSWFAFETMDSFLSSVYNTCNTTVKSEDDTDQQNADSITDINDHDASATDQLTQELNAERNQYLAVKRSHSASDEEVKRKKPSRYDSFTVERQDECDIMTKLWAKKLRKLPEERRDVIIYKINNLIYRETIDQYNQSNSETFSEINIVQSPTQVLYEHNELDSPNVDPMSSDDDDD